jgi:hypothetical protein
MSEKYKTIQDPFELIQLLRRDSRTIADFQSSEWSEILDAIFDPKPQDKP